MELTQAALFVLLNCLSRKAKIQGYDGWSEGQEQICCVSVKCLDNEIDKILWTTMCRFLLPQTVATMRFSGSFLSEEETIFPPVLQHTKVFQLVETTCVSPVQISLTFFYFCSAIPWVKVQVNILPASLTVLFALMAFKLTGGRSWLSLGSNVLSERSLVLSFGHRRGQIHLHINQ